MPILCKCKQCGKEFYLPPSRVKKGRGSFCSRKCMRKYYHDSRGTFHPTLKFRGEIDPKDWWKVQK